MVLLGLLRRGRELILIIVKQVPGLQHHMSQEKIPFDYPCNATRHEAEGGCAMQMEKEYWDKAGGWV